MENLIISFRRSYNLRGHHHHHHHVPEGLGVFPAPWSSRWSWSLHLFLGRPMFLRPFGWYCSACFGSLFVSILCTCCGHFFWYCFISFTMFCASVFFTNTGMNTIKSLKHVSSTLGPYVRFIWPAPFPYVWYRMLAVTQLDKLFDSMLYIPWNFMLFDWKQETF